LRAPHVSVITLVLGPCLLSILPPFFFLPIRRPPKSTLFPTRRSSDLSAVVGNLDIEGGTIRGGGNVQAQGATVWKGGYLSGAGRDRKSTRLNSSHVASSYAVFCLKKKRAPCGCWRRRSRLS